MNYHKRIILVGPSATGKNYIREKFREKGYQCDCSYTSRYPREGEKNGIDYHFIGVSQFMKMISNKEFYEWVMYGDNYYGTGLKEWKWCDIFIMETDGVKHINTEDKKDCLIIFVDTPLDVRLQRMKDRGWDDHKIIGRVKVDAEKFNNFKDYDLKISSE